MKPLVLVTGATDGIGRETALQLAANGWGVVIHGRTPASVSHTRDLLETQTPGSFAGSVTADYASLSQVREAGQYLAQNFPHLQGVVHNAGTFQTSRSLTEDGWETTWQVNHLAPALLNEYLMRPLDAGAPSRLVWVSSVAHLRGEIPWNDLNREKTYSGYEAYAASKLANALYAFKLARMMDPRRLGVYAIHPGVIPTKLLKTGFNRETGQSLALGAATSVFLISHPGMEGRTGEYWSEGQGARASEAARNEDLQDQLHEWTQRALALIS